MRLTNENKTHSSPAARDAQVKVWFQNRRTKHKRQKDEDGSDEGVSHSSSGDRSANPRISHSDSEEEEEDEHPGHLPSSGYRVTSEDPTGVPFRPATMEEDECSKRSSHGSSSRIA